MTDGVVLNAGSGGATVDTELCTTRSAMVQRVKLVLGAIDVDGGNALAPIAPTVSTTNGVTSLVLKASATVAGFLWAHVENATAVPGYVVIYNATTAPSTGALTAASVLGFQYLPSSGWADLNYTWRPIAGSTGIVILLTSASTPFTYTTSGGLTGAIAGVAA